MLRKNKNIERGCGAGTPKRFYTSRGPESVLWVVQYRQLIIQSRKKIESMKYSHNAVFYFEEVYFRAILLIFDGKILLRSKKRHLWIFHTPYFFRDWNYQLTILHGSPMPLWSSWCIIALWVNGTAVNTVSPLKLDMALYYRTSK